jgi:hypothetical protein
VKNEVSILSRVDPLAVFNRVGLEYTIRFSRKVIGPQWTGVRLLLRAGIRG